MQKWVILFLVSLMSLVINANASKNPKANPLLYSFNGTIDFKNITPEHISDATTNAIERARAELKKIYIVKKEKRTYINTLLAYDDLLDRFSGVTNLIYLMSNAHPDDSTYNKANEGVAILDKFSTEIALDENLYRAIKEFSETKEAKGLTGYKKKFLEETIRSFERNGFALTKEKRAELEKIQNRISDISLEFSKNIAAVNDYLLVTEQEIDGLDDNYKTSHKTEDGKYKIDLSYPSYQPFMKYSNSEEARKKLYIKFNTRASDKNLSLLTDLLKTRQELATLLGYKTFAEYQVEDRMAKTPKSVWDFENGLIDKLKIKANQDYQELLQVKRDFLKDNNVSVINPWEASFYNDKLLQQKYQLDQREVKKYFEVNKVIDGLFKISQHLFNVTFEEVKNPSVWHNDVRMFNVFDNGKVISHFYLDLYPRANKFSHAACFPMIYGKLTSKGYQTPIAALECNFPKATKDQPALMTQNDVETFFHEFGHVLHNILTKSEICSFAGTQVSRDFVEAPSQIFENWVWDYNSLSLFARHYQTNEILPKELFNKMLAAKNVGSGLGALQQVLYGVLDMTYHDKYDPNGTESTTDILKKLQNTISLYPFLDGTSMQASFGHLTGYGASYYGYLWSKVYAQDMFSIFEKNGIMDKTTGKRYRDIILSKGGTEKEIDLVKEFLQREPNQDAFLRSLGLNLGL